MQRRSEQVKKRSPNMSSEVRCFGVLGFPGLKLDLENGNLNADSILSFSARSSWLGLFCVVAGLARIRFWSSVFLRSNLRDRCISPGQRIVSSPQESSG